MKIITTPRTTKELKKLIKYCDAFLLGIKDYSVNCSNSFNLEEIIKLNKIIKKNRKQIFINLNKNLHNEDIKNIKYILLELNKLNIDGLFFYDIGIVNLKKKLCLNYDLVWAQEHFTTNYNTCNYWYDLNVKYGFISSEITKENILEIKKNTSMKLIVTLFGHVPMFTSKRHLVDNYLKHFNLTNKGTYIRKENKQYPIVDNKEGTTVYSNYVLNAIDEYLELSNNNIDYVFLNNFNIKQTQFRKIVQKHFKLTPNNLNKTKTYFEKLNLNLSKGFLYTETIYKVKNNE